jgi:Protein of unknown function (DUF4013)
MENKVQIDKAFGHMFDDPEWITKAIIGALLLVVPILNFTIYGYEVKVIRNVSKGQARPMPNWDDFSTYFTEGLYLGLARLVYGLPMLILVIPFFFLFLMPMVGALAAGNSDSRQADQLFGLLFGAGMLMLFLSFGLMMIYALLLGFSFPAITANYVKHGTFASCFDFKAILAFIKANLNNYLMVWVAGLLASLAVGAVYMVLSFIPCIGFLFALPIGLGGGFFILMVSGHALGQALALEGAPAVATPHDLAPA